VDCKTTSRRLGAYLDGELPHAGAAAVEEHLRQCPRCTAELAELRALSHALNGLEGAAAPSGFAARVKQAALARQEVRRQPVMLYGAPRARAMNRVLMRVAACLVAVAGLWVGMSAGGSAFAGNGQASSDATQAAEQNEFDLQMASLSAAPPGSIAEAYLAFASYDETGGQGQ